MSASVEHSPKGTLPSARSIRLREVFYVACGPNPAEVLTDVTVDLPADRRLALLGRRGSGKTTVVQLLSGLIEPDAGRIDREARLSFPVGFQAGLRPLLTLRENAGYVADLYGADPREVVDFIEAVARLGEYWSVRLRRTPTMERIRFAYALAYAIPFDTYLIDGSPGAGSPEFRTLCDALLEARARESGFILATRHERTARRYCDAGAVLHAGRLLMFDTLDEALEVYRGIEEPADFAATETVEPVDVDDEEDR